MQGSVWIWIMIIGCDFWSFCVHFCVYLISSPKLWNEKCLVHSDFRSLWMQRGSSARRWPGAGKAWLNILRNTEVRWTIKPLQRSEAHQASLAYSSIFYRNADVNTRLGLYLANLQALHTDLELHLTYPKMILWFFTLKPCNFAF